MLTHFNARKNYISSTFEKLSVSVLCYRTDQIFKNPQQIRDVYITRSHKKYDVKNKTRDQTYELYQDETGDMWILTISSMSPMLTLAPRQQILSPLSTLPTPRSKLFWRWTSLKYITYVLWAGGIILTYLFFDHFENIIDWINLIKSSNFSSFFHPKSIARLQNFFPKFSWTVFSYFCRCRFWLFAFFIWLQLHIVPPHSATGRHVMNPIKFITGLQVCRSARCVIQSLDIIILQKQKGLQWCLASNKNEGSECTIEMCGQHLNFSKNLGIL